ncbi:TPA: hypothetical protein L7M98_004319 [Klebsiella pneumoniae]|nr:hypothetical protein [Klebsiella pneumoniae]HBQ2116471.1 hypothetical protein [Klebsiella pneumoniae]HBX5523698.1 hypothetical protein [Klebsiella pneumoniae]
MHELRFQKPAEKAFQAEIILSMMKKRTAASMEDCEIDALLAMLKGLIGDISGFLGEEASREEEENV